MILPRQSPPIPRAITHGDTIAGRWVSFSSLTVEQRKDLINRVRFSGRISINGVGCC